MDAKPQRPARVFRIRDENVPLQDTTANAAVSKQLIHQRNHSSPALCTLDTNAIAGSTNNVLAKPGTQQMPPKRTAFSDVSNVQRRHTVKDKSSFSLIQRPDTSISSRPPQRCGNTGSSAMQPSSSVANITDVQDRPKDLGKKLSSRSGAQRTSSSIGSEKTTEYKRKNIMRKRETVEKNSMARESQRTSARNDLPVQPDETTAATEAMVGAEDGNSGAFLAKDNTKFEIRRDEESVTGITDGLELNDLSFLPGIEPHSIAEYAHENTSDRVNDDVTRPEEIVCREEDYIRNGELENLKIEEEASCYPVEEEVLFPRVSQSSQKELETAKQAVDRGMYPHALEDESWDISMVAEYGDDIFQYMREMELRLMPNPHYMDTQNELDWSMRSVLVDWLVQVHLRFALLPETLFLTVNIIDRFLSCKLVSAARLQLVGATAIFLASKYEEVVCPSLSEVVFMVDKAYSGEEILRAERYMLNMLSFDLGWPGPMSFLRRISKADEYDYDTRFLAKYFLEVAMMDERFIGSPPSFVAAGAHCLSRLILRKGSWSEAHAYYSNYTYSQLYPLLHLLVECCKFPSSHHSSVYEKYTHRRLQQISFLVESEIQRGFQLPLPANTSDSSSDEMEPWSMDTFIDRNDAAFDGINLPKHADKEPMTIGTGLLPVAVKP